MSKYVNLKLNPQCRPKFTLQKCLLTLKSSTLTCPRHVHVRKKRVFVQESQEK